MWKARRPDMAFVVHPVCHSTPDLYGILNVNDEPSFKVEESHVKHCSPFSTDAASPASEMFVAATAYAIATVAHHHIVKSCLLGECANLPGKLHFSSLAS